MTIVLVTALLFALGHCVELAEDFSGSFQSLQVTFCKYIHINITIKS